MTSDTRQIRQNLKSATVKSTNDPKNPFDFKSVIPTGDLALFSRRTGTLVGKFARVYRSEIPRNLKSATVKLPTSQKSPVFFTRSGQWARRDI